MRDFASACFGCMSKTESAKSEKEQTLRDDGRPGDGSRRFYNRTSAVVARALMSRGRQANPVLTYETALRRFPSASLAKPLPEQKKLPDSLIAAAQCTNYSLVLPWHFKLKDKQIETL
jgi:hypothetical protein